MAGIFDEFLHTLIIVYFVVIYTYKSCWNWIDKININITHQNVCLITARTSNEIYWKWFFYLLFFIMFQSSGKRTGKWTGKHRSEVARAPWKARYNELNSLLLISLISLPSDHVQWTCFKSSIPWGDWGWIVTQQKTTDEWQHVTKL